MPGEQRTLALPTQALLGDLNNLDRFGTDQLSIQMLISQITDLLVERIQFLHDLSCEAYALDNPVLAEVTESDRLRSGICIRHGVADHHRLAQNRIVGVVPDVVTIGILEGAKCQGGFVIHHPYAALAVFLLHREVQADDIVIGDGCSGHTDFCTTFCGKDTRRSFLSIAINKGSFLCTAHALGKGVD